MRFLTTTECQSWSNGYGVQTDERGYPERLPGTLRHVRFFLPQTPGQLTWLCSFISHCLKPRRSGLLWVTEWGVFPNSENWHLYYRLRESHGDRRLLHEAPGHQFLDYEDADVVSFLQVGVLNGWDIHVLPHLAYGEPDTARAFISHDEWVALSHRDAETVEEWRKDWSRRSIDSFPSTLPNKRLKLTARVRY